MAAYGYSFDRAYFATRAFREPAVTVTASAQSS